MENYRLLEKHKKRLSAYFALSILLSLWVVEFVFLTSTFFGNNFKLEDKLKMKYEGVINVINNLDNYSFNNSDPTINTILEKSLVGVTIFKNKNKILGNIDSYNLGNDNIILNSKSYKYYQDTYNFNSNNYKIIIKSENKYSYHYMLLQYLYFSLFSLPFFIIFFLIGYIFVGKNLKPIKETIDSLETFSGNINHEMKTPLTEIISTLSLTKETKNNYEKAIDDSLNSAKKLNKILDSMLGIINLVDSSFKKQEINIINEIKEVIKENSDIIKEKNITIQSKFKNKQYYLYSNKEHLNICIGNIIKNAIKYSYNDSIVKIKFKKGVLQVKDYGIGIEKKNLKNVYKSYFRENYSETGGYGLGLALVKKIIDINKWEMNVESEKNKGTEVTLIFN
ncbi:MAG: HAMP domain-containing sensor histidine kinase [Candidatus Gracilibacteria bacterium]